MKQTVELHNLCYLSDTRTIKDHWQMGGECGMHGTDSNVEQIINWKM
jgi:hypothetical protein